MKKLTFILLFILPLTIFSQEELTLQKAIENTLANNYDIRLVKKDIEIADNNVSLGNSGFLPELNASGGYSYSMEDNQTQLEQGTFGGNNNQTTNLNGSIALDWTLFDGFAMFRNYERFGEVKNLNEVKLQLEIETRINEIINTYFDAVRVSNNLKILEEAVKYSKERVEYLNSQEEFGNTLKIEILQAEVDLNTDLANLKRSRVQIDRLINQIKFLMGQSDDAEYTLSDEIKINELEEYNSLKDKLFNNNSSIMQAIQTKTISELDKELVEAAYYPRVSASGSYSYNEQTSELGFIRGQLNRGFTVSLNATWNLFNGFKDEIRNENAILSIQKQEILISRIKSMMVLNLKNSYKSFIDLKDILEMEESNLATAEENFNRSKELFKYGKINSLDLRQSQINLLRAEQRIIDLKYELKAIENEIQFLTGSLIK